MKIFLSNENYFYRMQICFYRMKIIFIEFCYISATIDVVKASLEDFERADVVEASYENFERNWVCSGLLFKISYVLLNMIIVVGG